MTVSMAVAALSPGISPETYVILYIATDINYFNIMKVSPVTLIPCLPVLALLLINGCSAPKNLVKQEREPCRLVAYDLSGHEGSYPRPFFTCRDSCGDMRDGACRGLEWTPGYLNSPQYAADSAENSSVYNETCNSWTRHPEGYVCRDCSLWEKAPPSPFRKYRFYCLDTSRLNPWPKAAPADSSPAGTITAAPPASEPARQEVSPFEFFLEWGFRDFYFEKEPSIFSLSHAGLIQYLNAEGIPTYELNIKNEGITLDRFEYSITYDFTNPCLEKMETTNRVNRVLVRATESEWLEKTFARLKEKLGGQFKAEGKKAVWKTDSYKAVFEVRENGIERDLLFSVTPYCY